MLFFIIKISQLIIEISKCIIIEFNNNIKLGQYTLFIMLQILFDPYKFIHKISLILLILYESMLLEKGVAY